MPQFPQQWRSRSDAEDNTGGPKRMLVGRGADALRARVMWTRCSASTRMRSRGRWCSTCSTRDRREVAAESVRRMVTRLRRRGLRPAIRRTAWQVMTNHERLEWLLSETLTVPLMRPGDDVVILETRDR